MLGEDFLKEEEEKKGNKSGELVREHLVVSIFHHAK